MKKRKLLSAIVAGMVLSATLALTGCSKSGDDSQSSKIDSAQEINLVGYEYKTLDPSAASDTETFTTYTQVYEGLTREVTKDGKVTTELAGAEKIDKSADGTVYTIKLRDAKWSDGKTVTAKDYEFSWKRLCDPKVSEDYLMFLDEIGVKGAKEFAEGKGKADNIGVKATDDKTLVVSLKQPTPFFENALAFKCLVPQREDKVKELGSQYGQDYAKMVYNGPFIVSEFAKGSKIVYKKNENYWDEKNVKLQAATANILEEPTTIAKMFDSKELDVADTKYMTGDVLVNEKKRADSGEVDRISGVDASTYYLVFNTKTKALSNSKVRLAISEAFERQAFLDTVFKRNLPAMGIVPSRISVGDKEYRKAVDEPLKSVKDDPKKLFEEGLKEAGITDPSKVELNLLSAKASSLTQAQGQFIQNQIEKDFGIKVKITHAVDGPSYFNSRSKGEFDICLGGWGADYNDVNSFFGLFMTGNGNNNGKYSNPEYDKLVTDANKELDVDKRINLFKKAENILIAQDAAVAPIYYRDVNTFTQKYVKGFYVPLFGGYYDLKNAYIQGK